MRTIAFEFDIDDVVKTPFDEKGIIVTMGYDHAGVQYYVKTSSGGNWFKESEIRKF